MSPSVLEPTSQILNSPPGNFLDLKSESKRIEISALLSLENSFEPVELARGGAYIVMMDASAIVNQANSGPMESIQADTLFSILNRANTISLTLNQTDTVSKILRRPDSQLATINQAYVIDGRSEVDPFVLRYHIGPLLEDASEHLKATFGDKAIRVLKLVTDDEGSQTLFCFVMVPDSLASARASLKAFDKRWWIERCGSAAGKLNFDFELI